MMGEVGVDLGVVTCFVRLSGSGLGAKSDLVSMYVGVGPQESSKWCMYRP
jgi:hypothetical protein